jgi:hypothetical protein
LSLLHVNGGLLLQKWRKMVNLDLDSSLSSYMLVCRK